MHASSGKPAKRWTDVFETNDNHLLSHLVGYVMGHVDDIMFEADYYHGQRSPEKETNRNFAGVSKASEDGPFKYTDFDIIGLLSDRYTSFSLVGTHSIEFILFYRLCASLMCQTEQKLWNELN
ncbi:unnamed protein product [Angiostrongylus costaricensis]|uniref:PDEase domain-containing protein n=1 Tax=Angiostrongylus costaricensis TaxID=334426 RepID=A0A0R3Q0J0_ANGCS|nr:unnamed protein product [Angiostrongylus costaricensis]